MCVTLADFVVCSKKPEISFERGLCFVPQDEQKAAAMAGLSEEGPPKADTEEVRTDVWGMEVGGGGGGGDGFHLAKFGAGVRCRVGFIFRSS